MSDSPNRILVVDGDDSIRFMIGSRPFDIQQLVENVRDCARGAA